MYRLTDKQQAVIMLLVVLIPPLVVWMSSPDPLFQEQNLRWLMASLLCAVLVFLKEFAAYKPRVNKPSTP